LQRANNLSTGGIQFVTSRNAQERQQYLRRSQAFPCRLSAIRKTPDNSRQRLHPTVSLVVI
jgi:hypothetical protein